MNKRKKITLIFLILFYTIKIFAQNVSEQPSETKLEATKILEEARKTIYGNSEPKKIKTLFISTSSEIYTKQTVTDENRKTPTAEHWESVKSDYSMGFPDFLRKVLVKTSKNSSADVKAQIVLIANKSDIDLKGEVIVNGQKTALGNEIISSLAKGYEKVGNISPIFSEKASPFSSRSTLNTQTSLFTFPLILNDFYGNTPKFDYVGKATADGKTAFVLEVVPGEKSESNKGWKEKTRYFFDSVSHLLIMVTQDYEADDFLSNTTTYFSDHKSFNGVLIPTKIKEESKTILKFDMTVAGLKIKPSETIRVTDTTLKEFEIDREFNPAIFEIKK